MTQDADAILLQGFVRPTTTDAASDKFRKGTWPPVSLWVFLLPDNSYEMRILSASIKTKKQASAIFRRQFGFAPSDAARMKMSVPAARCFYWQDRESYEGEKMFQAGADFIFHAARNGIPPMA
jgi:hypothetical protein